MAWTTFVLVLATLAFTPTLAAWCARDGSDYTYTEVVLGDTRTIVSNGCPNHPWYQLNPNKAYVQTTTYRLPSYPQFVGTAAAVSTSSANVDLSSKGGAVGIFFNGAMLFSPYGGPSYGTVTSFSSSATYAEGASFDQCGCHASSTSQASYHCHVPPSCLLNQLGQTSSSGVTSGAHSPQIGWANDGFPLYGPHGPGGIMMKTCTVTGGTYGDDVCTDDCGGYYSNSGSIDNYVYRYYIQGTYNDGTSCNEPGCPSPGEAYYPNTPVCYRGCCPSGVSCSSEIESCSGTYSDGYLSSFTPSVPTINNLNLASGLPQNCDACACDSLTIVTCSEKTWNSGGNLWTAGNEVSCPATSCTPVSPSPASPSPSTSASSTPSFSSWTFLAGFFAIMAGAVRSA